MMSRGGNMKATRLSLLFFFLVLRAVVLADLRIGFYNSTCPSVESIIHDVVQKRFAADNSIVAALLRMHFHDCFVRGCDASILIDSTSNKPSEKTAGPNFSVRGYEIIDEAKSLLESQCPLTVSCADIITLATRDAVALAGGPIYSVPTGRRDGLVSNPDDVNLPGPTFSVSLALQSFQAKNLNLNDMVSLLGAHTVGVAHCSLFEDRLSNFQGTGKPDPSMDPALVSRLKGICARPNDPTAFLDQNTSFIFDNQFYRQILVKQGVLQLDEEIATDGTTRGMVSGFASNNDGFKKSFASAMVKMGSIEVLVGSAGEIRKSCRVFNSKTPPPPPPPSETPPLPKTPPTQSPPPAPKTPPTASPPSVPKKPSTPKKRPAPKKRRGPKKPPAAEKPRGPKTKKPSKGKGKPPK